MLEIAMDDGSQSSSGMMSQEQETLEKFFINLGQFTFDKAKDLAEKEKEVIQKSHQVNTVYIGLLSSLGQLAIAEKNYASLLFLLPKGFLRKDSSVKSAYEALLTDFQKLEERSNSVITPASSPALSLTPPASYPSSSSLGSGSLSAADNSQVSEALEKLAGHLCGQLYHFANARIEMMEFYEKMCNMSTMHFMKFEELVSYISQTVNQTQKLFHHPYLSPIKSSFSYECEILMQLLEAQLYMQQWQFLPSLLRLHEAHSKLGAWSSPVGLKENKKCGAHHVLRPLTFPPLYHWLYKLKCALVSKFSLYFHKTLSQQTSSNEMKNICSHASIDYYQKIISFQKRTDAVCVALVLNTFNLENYRGHGYQYPKKAYEPPKGLDSYPAIFCYPVDQPISHWPCIVMIMNDKAWDIRNADDVVCFYDKNVQTTYFLARIDPFMTVVVILESKRTEKEGHITSFLHELCIELRCNKIFASLKPGSK